MITILEREVMTQKFEIGDRVYFPVSKIKPKLERCDEQKYYMVFHKSEVVDIKDRSIKIKLIDGEISDWLSTKFAHKNIGIMIFNIGDGKSEQSLLNPLSESITQYCKLLVSDDYFVCHKIRTFQELKGFFKQEQGAYTHIILVGHGKKNAIKFVFDEWVHVDDIISAFNNDGFGEKLFISTCCETGYKDFSSSFSKSKTCTNLISPFHEVHGAIASQFTQTFLAFHFLKGETIRTAFKHARDYTPGSANFRLWDNGAILEGMKKPTKKS